jgi:hypothetical protein
MRTLVICQASKPAAMAPKFRFAQPFDIVPDVFD